MTRPSYEIRARLVELELKAMKIRQGDVPALLKHDINELMIMSHLFEGRASELRWVLGEFERA